MARQTAVVTVDLRPLHRGQEYRQRLPRWPRFPGRGGPFTPPPTYSPIQRPKTL
ncbi:hypothetical protein J4732_15440 [Serratia marcescens]|uniref:Uncharacterized protein n=1 Tax=Serratia marcescens TaxID=615 RepID=A0A939NKA6_SERMA|nr:hypothetical protein [Serratia marcescens]MBO2007086.1 hypothetical protein [Serratia marcescens]